MTARTVVKVGEYEVSHDNGSHFTARRNGQLWRDLTGDNLVLALVSRIEQLERLWVEPTEDMTTAGLGEVQRIMDEWSDEHFDFSFSDVTDDMASDLATFVLQAMATKLPKLEDE